MSDAPLILGVSGLRGIVGESLTPELAVRFAGAFGGWLRERAGDEANGDANGEAQVVIGRDGRAGGEWLMQSVIGGLLAAGCDVEDVGVLMTPTIGLLAQQGADGGVVITASHNPQEWNGIKCLVCEETEAGRVARAPTLAEANEIIARYESGVDWSAGAGEPVGVSRVESAWTGHVVEALGGMYAASGEVVPGFLVVLDSVNSSGSRTAAAFFENSACRLVQLHGESTGVFPHTPEPTAENLSGAGGLCDAVPGLKADVGFAQDPDGDRLAVVDERGRYIGEEYTLALCAEAVLGAMDQAERGSAKGAVLVANLSTSRMIDDVAAAYGARVERTAVGEANVVERMLAIDAGGAGSDGDGFVVLGGEGNGGVIWPEIVHVRDSLGSMALVLGLMARTGLKVSALVEKVNGYATGGAGYAIVKRKVEIASKADAGPAVEKVSAWGSGLDDAAVDLQDGCRVDLGDWSGGGAAWVHVRASNTEPIMRLIAEAGTVEAAEGLLAEVEGVIGT